MAAVIRCRRWVMTWLRALPAAGGTTFITGYLAVDPVGGLLWTTSTQRFCEGRFVACRFRHELRA